MLFHSPSSIVDLFLSFSPQASLAKTATAWSLGRKCNCESLDGGDVSCDLRCQVVPYDVKDTEAYAENNKLSTE